MKYFKLLILMTLSILLVTCTFSQEESKFKVTKLTDHLYKLTTDGGGYVVKIIASVGDDGILLVDTGQKETAEDLKATLKTLGNGIPKFIINTHEHVEHIGGNAVFGKDPIIVGHRNLRIRLRSGSYLFDEFPDETLPDVTFTDSLSLYFNGEEIKLIAFPGSHSDNDVIVWFTESGVVCVGALSNGSHFPSVDGVSGNVLKYPEIVQKVIDVLPDDVTIIPGHGEDGTMKDLRAFHDMLVKTTEIVQVELAKGKDYDALQKENVLKDWESFEGGYVDKNQWIHYLVEGFQNPNPKKSLYESIYYALKEKGDDAAIEHYYDLKTNYYDEYRFQEKELMYIAYKLFRNEKILESIKFFELCVKEYPRGDNAWICYYYLGKGYNAKGDRELAVKYFKKSLELNPDNTEAAEILKNLEKD